MRRWATFSEDGVYRYELERVWEETLPLVMFLLLNPSKAGADEDDATVRKCIGFARRLGYGGILVGNMYGYVATDPRNLVKRWKDGHDVVGPNNDHHLLQMATRSAMIIGGWGAAPIAQRREARVTYLLRDATVPDRRLHALRETAGGSPCHPLYLPYSLTPQPWPTKDVA